MTDWARPALTVDVALLARHPAPRILLVQRGTEPFAGSWALPGGFVDQGERVHDAAARELDEETGVTVASLTLLGVYDTPGRDPRGWTVSSACSSASSPRTGPTTRMTLDGSTSLRCRSWRSTTMRSWRPRRLDFARSAGAQSACAAASPVSGGRSSA